MRHAFIDLSHTIEHGMTTHPGIPPPEICDFLSREASRLKYAPGTEFQIGRINMAANTGTYVDAPFHRFEHGKDLSALDLARLADLDGLVVRAEGHGRAIGVEQFAGLALAGKAVLVHTGWSRHWRTERYLSGEHPFLTRAAAELLRDAAPAVVGIDSMNIDDTADGTRPVHTVLLGADIPIVEHLRGLELLPDRGFRFHAVPPKVKAFGTWPVRAFAQVAAGSGPEEGLDPR